MAVVDDQDGYEPVKSVDLENGAGAKDASVPAPAKLKVLMFDLSGLPPMVQLLLLTSGVFLFFILCGSLEENMFNNVNGFTFGWYMTVFELLGFALTAALERRAAGEQVFEHRAPLVNHVIVAVSMTFARGLTNMSLQYLNYPSQVIFKSLKLIVVLIGSIVIYKKRYPSQELVSCGMLVVSAILFTLGDADVSPRFSWTGIGVVLLSLFFDALHSNSQEHVLQAHNASTLELMIFGNLFAAAMSFLVTAVSGELLEAYRFCGQQPVIYLYFTVRMLFVYGGVLCFVAIIKRFGVVAATTITTVRKVLSIILSFLVFPKPFSMAYVIAGVVFCAGTYLNLNVQRRVGTRTNHKE
ncbi:Sugar phosphate transporter domain-containing protein [Plasmodiophora brassicae]